MANQNTPSIIQKAGYVGIGTNNPSQLLEVKGSTPLISVYNMSGDGGLRFRNDAGTVMWNAVHNNSDGNFYFKEAVNSLNVLTLTYSTGRVGIGTASPSQKLHVVGNAWINRPSNKVDNASCTEFGSRVEFNNSFSSTQSGYTIFYYPTYNVFRIGADYDGNIGGVQPDLQLGRSPAIHIYNSGSSLGYVGVGTTTPQVTLDINGNTGITSSNYLYFGHSTTNIGAWQTRTYSSGGVQYWNVNGFQINNTGYGSSTWLNVNSSGYVRVYERLGVGIDPTMKVHVSESGSTISSGNAISTSTMKGVMIQNTNNDNSSVGIWFATNGVHWTGITSQRNDYTSTWGTDLRFYTHENATNDLTYARQRMVITSEGAMGLGVTPTNTGGRFEASNDIVAYSSSDIRFKNNVTQIDNPMEKISKIRGVYFDWIEMEKFHGNKGHDIGIIAQEVEAVLPEIVTTRENGYKAVKYERIVPLLIESIKELNKKVEAQQTLINSLLSKDN